jgi:hypothetical protein
VLTSEVGSAKGVALSNCRLDLSSGIALYDGQLKLSSRVVGMSSGIVFFVFIPFPLLGLCCPPQGSLSDIILWDCNKGLSSSVLNNF